MIHQNSCQTILNFFVKCLDISFHLIAGITRKSSCVNTRGILPARHNRPDPVWWWWAVGIEGTEGVLLSWPGEGERDRGVGQGGPLERNRIQKLEYPPLPLWTDIPVKTVLSNRTTHTGPQQNLSANLRPTSFLPTFGGSGLCYSSLFYEEKCCYPGWLPAFTDRFYCQSLIRFLQ